MWKVPLTFAKFVAKKPIFKKLLFKEGEQKWISEDSALRKNKAPLFVTRRPHASPPTA